MQAPNLFAYNVFVLKTNASHTLLKFSVGVMWETSVHRGDETIRALRSNTTVHIRIIHLHSHSAFTSEAPPWPPTNQYLDSNYIPHTLYMVWQWRVQQIIKTTSGKIHILCCTCTRITSLQCASTASDTHWADASSLHFKCLL